MNTRGFTILEVLIAISLCSLLISAGYGLLITLEKFHEENHIYHQVIQLMQIEVNKWRSNLDVESKIHMVDQVIVEQNVVRDYQAAHIESAEIRFTWQIGKKQFQVNWELIRFLTHNENS